ncbi:MAG TPA: hypothetical protein VN931_03850 [Fibrobacteria bacterium]|nr:hypothetical protein [Fibrobacteria bacterium]
MRRIATLLVGGILLLASHPRADWVVVPGEGVTAWVPAGWVLVNEELTDTTRIWHLYDTTITAQGNRRHNGDILLEAQSGVGAQTDVAAEQWVQNEGESWDLYVQTAPLGGVVYQNDSTLVGGLFAWEVYGESLDSAGDSVLTTFARTTAHGDVGWDFWVQSDTSDADTAIATYAGLLDSLQLDTTVTSLPTGIRARSAPGLRSNALSSIGGSLRIQALHLDRVEVMDLMGRMVPGTLHPGNGEWSWRPNSERTTTVFARVQADGEVWTRRLVLEP